MSNHTETQNCEEICKRELCRDIGYFFGSYSEEGGQFCITANGKVYRYASMDELLTEWHKILTGDKKLAWEWHEEIKRIEDLVIAPKLEETNNE